MSVLDVMKVTVTCGKVPSIGALEGQRDYEEAFFSSTPSSYFCRYELY